MSNFTNTSRMLYWNYYNESSLLNNIYSNESRTRITITIKAGANEEPMPDFGRKIASIVVPIIFSIIFFVGIMGNSLVITVMTRIYRCHGQGLNNTNRFIFNLAISDLTFLLFCVPFQAPIYTLPDWVFGKFMCTFTNVVQELAMIASIYTLVALSVDRFLAVAYATSSKSIRSKKNSIRGLIFIWIAATGIAAPSVLTRVLINFNGFNLCIPNFKIKMWYNSYQLIVFVLGYLLPLVIILSCYVGLLYAMCVNARKNAVTARSKSSIESRKKVTRIVILVVIVFAICWFPHHLTTLWVLYGNFKFTQATLGFRLLAHCMSYANSCMNPLIYAFVSKKFRQDLHKAFPCTFLCDGFGSLGSLASSLLRPWVQCVRSLRERSPTLHDSTLPSTHRNTEVIVQGNENGNNFGSIHIEVNDDPNQEPQMHLGGGLQIPHHDGTTMFG